MSMPEPEGGLPFEAIQTRNLQKTLEVLGSANLKPARETFEQIGDKKTEKNVKRSTKMFQAMAQGGPKAAAMQKMIDLFQPLISIVEPFNKIFSGFVTAFLGGFIQPFMPLIGELTGELGKFIPLMKDAGRWFGDAIKWFVGEGGLLEVLEPVGGFFLGIGDSIAEMFGKVFDTIGGVGGGIAEGIEEMFDFGKGIINGFIDAINLAIDTINLIPGVTLDKIPKLAEGGIIQQTGVYMLGDNKSGTEMVLPLERAEEMGFGGGNEEEILNDIKFLLQEQNRRRGFRL